VRARRFALDKFTGVVGRDSLCSTCVAAGVPCITDCVMAELEKLGPKYRLALRLAKDPRFERIPCAHKGTYADDCIVNRIKEV
jgi:U3 small nucleolar RNA-associated protein 24